MKIEIIHNNFQPVIITIETQDELDRLQGIFNHSDVHDIFPELAMRIGIDSNRYYEMLVELLDKRRKK